MPVSEQDRRKLDSQIRSLRGLENDNEVSPEEASAGVAAANADRARAGIPPLKRDEDVGLPEEGFYRRARALGLLTRRRRDT